MFERLKFGDKKVIFIKSNKIIEKKGEITLNYNQYLLYNLLLHINPISDCIIVYSIIMEYRHCFEDGLKVRIVYWTSEDGLKRYEFFFKTLYGLLINRGLSSRHVEAYLEGLYKSNVYEVQGEEKILEKLTTGPDSFFSMVASVAAKNEPTLSTDSNFLNLYTTSKIQQQLLNVKRNAYTRNGEKISCEWYTPNTLLQHEKIYMLEPEMIYISAELDVAQFEKFLQYPIFSYKHIMDSYYKIAIPKVHFYLLNNISGKNPPIQYTFVEPSDDMILALDTNPKISDLILANKTSIIYFYGIICKSALEEFLQQTHGYFQTFKIVSLVNREFFYVKFFLHKAFVGVMYKLFAKFMNNPCRDGELSQTLLHKQWSDRCCLHLFYHTHFQVNTQNMTQMEIDASKINIVTYRYLKTTEALDLMVHDETTALILANYICQVERAFIIAETTKAAKITQIVPQVDGPLLSAISTRTCENVTGKYDDTKEFSINNNQYLASFHNTTYTSLGNNPVNKLEWYK